MIACWDDRFKVDALWQKDIAILSFIWPQFTINPIDAVGGQRSAGLDEELGGGL